MISSGKNSNCIDGISLVPAWAANVFPQYKQQCDLEVHNIVISIAADELSSLSEPMQQRIKQYIKVRQQVDLASSGG